MNQWYYSKDGTQVGPVSRENLVSQLKDGSLDPKTTLTWNESMTDWVSAEAAPGLLSDSPTDAAMITPEQPFAYPLQSGPLREIEAGSEPLIPTAAIKRGFDLTNKNIGILLGISAISLAISLLLELITASFTGTSQQASSPETLGKVSMVLVFLSEIFSNLVGLFICIGMLIVGLRVASGKPITIGTLFSGGPWFLKMLGATFIFYIALILGLILLIVPGIIIGLRFGFYGYAIVDKNMGVIDAFKYSAQLTKGNALNIFVLYLLTIGVAIAGFLALCVGYIYALPIIIISSSVAYRWLQYGGKAVLDDPATGAPLIAGAIPEDIS